MSIREAIGRYQKAATILAVVVAIGAVVYLVHSSTARPPSVENQSFFTTDDGKTVFVDIADHVPPFDHDGQPAYRVYMFSSDGGATKFPGYLERCTTAAKPRIEAALRDLKSGASRFPPSVSPHDVEVKKPGAGNPWISRADPVAAKITNVTGPNGPLEIIVP